jgi:hypothetical protein
MPNVQHKRGTRAALDALAAAGSLRAGQLYLITDEQRIAMAVSGSAYQAYARQSEAGDPWTRYVLGSDFTNATTSFVTIGDGAASFSWTPPPSSSFVVEAELLLWTANASLLPRPGVSVGAGQAYGTLEIVHPGLNTATFKQAAGSFLNLAAALQMPADNLPGANTPWLAKVVVRGRSGAAPGAIALQMAAEAAGANTAFVKAGSEMRCRAF